MRTYSIPKLPVVGLFSQPPHHVQRPHCCPVCNGTGWVSFNPSMPSATTTSCPLWPCAPCKASGVLWG